MPIELTKESVLQTALDCVTKSRSQTHGEAYAQLDQTAQLWNAYIQDHVFSASEVAICIALMKISRSCHGEFNPDDFVDLVGYGAIAGECADREQRIQKEISGKIEMALADHEQLQADAEVCANWIEYLDKDSPRKGDPDEVDNAVSRILKIKRAK